ncbi:AAA family ATPase [Methylovulum psychrotolerans]|uniref:Exodeoxyribonuclease V subunit alpha n=1 Tax=Methylovulum psychrotolerans TaxID=1704499 RepID=A0A2S5CIU5_9GAMM|nr:ATP-dependent RecD-like DNA helicase [Methylovulum psychrotolerans]POZ50725.1 exodeoxyribonuclease V subunit alpha [Methylovulum psychrotolerans]
MIEGSRQLPMQHITVRVPWHDNGWNGTFCNKPCVNTSCTVLPRIASGRDDSHEADKAGTSIEGLEQNKLPPCVDEHGTLMAKFSQVLLKNHPYTQSASVTHGHFEATPYTIQPYSVAVIPFRWMLKENTESRSEDLQLDYNTNREPKMDWQDAWIQEGKNQRIMLDSFFSAVKPDESLVFFYAKRTPLIEDPRRVIIGVGRVKSVGKPAEYRYKRDKPANAISGFLWERGIGHSIRPNGKEGFLLPYQHLLDLAEADVSIDLAACTAFAPDEHFESYSYGSELLPQDGAIASLLAIEKAIKAMCVYFEAPWQEYLKWIDNELNRLWQIRGAFPGLGAAFNAFGLPHGNLLAWYLSADEESGNNPWPLLEKALSDSSSLPDYLQQGLGDTLYQKWQKLPPERRALLALLSRFTLTNSQAKRWYQPTEREKAGISTLTTDGEILANPYRIYEEDRLQLDAIAFAIIDRGMFPPENLRKDFPIPEPSQIKEAVDKRRIRALMIQVLEEAGSKGHTLLPDNWLIQQIRDLAMKPECPLDIDTLGVVSDFISPFVEAIELKNGNKGFQLDRYIETAQSIKSIIIKRQKGRLHEGDYDWAALVDAAIESGSKSVTDANESLARKEKSKALEMLFKSRVSVLMGAAGTGKSTLIKALCNIDAVKKGGVLLLAPTGKARVRLEQTSGQFGKGKTIAQFLNGLQRYDGNTGRYFINTNAGKSSAHKTVVIDECSMLTEEQLAGLLDAIKGVERLVLVGDPKQLPPIGAGRPYVDIVQQLMPENIDSLFPKVSYCYAELTVTRRQQNQGLGERVDILLANAFSGKSQDAGADEVWNILDNDETPYVKLVKWNQPDQLFELLTQHIVKELHLTSDQDEVGFECSLGGTAGRTHVFFNTAYGDKPGASEKAENWQILSPHRAAQSGVEVINRYIQAKFRRDAIYLSSKTGYAKRIPNPAGPQGIIWGDKVINIKNDGKRKVFPDKENHYVANGDIGIVTGYYKKKGQKFFNKIEVELSAQPGFGYKYWPNEFDAQEATPPLELAYALTVHKTQGSEFGTTFLIIPNPCRLLSREMLYTALTRHKNKVVILHQGDFKELVKLVMKAIRILPNE